jgi:spore coat protein A
MKMAKKSVFTALTIALISIMIAIPIIQAVSAVPLVPVTLDPKTIPKYVNQLSDASGNPLAPPVYEPEYTTATAEYYTVDVTQFTQQILPAPFGPTTVWGYGGRTTGNIYLRNAPGPTFEATKGKEIYVRYQNKLTGLSHLFAVDPTLHWANPNNIPMMDAITEAVAGLAPPYPPGYNGAPYIDPVTGVTTNPNGWNAQFPVPIIPHLHGGEVQSTSDGHPEAWFTAGGATYLNHGTAYNTKLTTWWDGTPIANNEAAFLYPNAQPPTTLWYHDHALGITRINVMSGLAGFYMLRDTVDKTARAGYIPPIAYEMPIVIQDRTFTPTGQFYFPAVGLNPEHPYWMPEFFGDTIMVNGLVWPNMNVKQGQYRLRLLDGSNARFYTLSFSNKMPFTVIGSDGGYLPAPVTVTELTIGPGERYDVIVDFSLVPANSKLILKNTAAAPFKGGGGGGTPANPQTVGQIMQFTVLGTTGWIPTAPIPAALNTIPVLPTPTVTRQMTLLEVMGPGGPLEVLLDGKKWGAPVSETPTLGSTEEWIIVNPTADTHPIHLHLTQFQLVSRQPFQVNKYVKAWTLLNGMPPVTSVTNPPYQLYLQGKLKGPNPEEMGWKDTIQMNPGEVTIIRVRFAPIDGSGSYPFDATVGPGYVWHCHILDHEDNEMMRPYLVVP